MKKADPDSLPPTSAKTMALLVLLLIGLIIATAKASLYPSQPATWEQLHNPRANSLADTNRILTESGAIIEAFKASQATSTETWNMKHRTGTWTILVRYTKSPAGDAVQSIQIRREISHLPSFTRTWDYPEPSASAVLPVPATTTPAQ
ncbi:hypothetical protein [Prosthecobacter sp.]|uniref:hypothetical protein n=1 Tax=Prosthecobacter sp. TaxID=1965333 RepID=UPI0024890B4A|nr:hypothetical protein [Prosthecobacter sp.]MDI1313269.1 hypothetical protein [Prosthecobacter sp.]